MAKQVLSERGQRYLQTLERRPYADMKQVKAALKAAKVPATQAVLDFHETFAGYVISVWGEEGALGIIQPEIHACESWAKRMKVGGYLDGKEKMLACADIHMSWEMMIALDGTFYCNGPEASSYFMWTEQTAYLWDFWNSQKCTHVELPKDMAKVLPALEAALAPHRIDALSDDYAQAYGTDRFAVTIGQGGGRVVVLVVDGPWPKELAALKPKPAKKPRAKPTKPTKAAKTKSTKKRRKAD